jgi:hypothetical protein
MAGDRGIVLLGIYVTVQHKKVLLSLYHKFFVGCCTGLKYSQSRCTIVDRHFYFLGLVSYRESHHVDV